MAKGDAIAAEVKAALSRDKQGGSAPWQHCNLCPTPDSEPCVRSCANVRDEAAKQDGVIVSY